jgi:hypothetical protein
LDQEVEAKIDVLLISTALKLKSLIAPMTKTSGQRHDAMMDGFNTNVTRVAQGSRVNV